MDDGFHGRVHAALEGEPASPDFADRVLRAVHLRRRGPTRMMQILTAALFLVFALGLGASLRAATQHRLSASLSPPGTSANPRPVVSSEPIHEAVVVDRFPFDSPARMCSAVLVVDAAVKTLGPGHWNTPNGLRPPDLDKQTLFSKGYQIVTPVQLSRQQYLLDHRHQPTAEFATLGGWAGEDYYMVFQGIAQLRPGVRYLIVFTPGAVAGKGISQAFLIASDVFSIDTEEMVLLKPRVVEQGRVSQEELKVPLSQVAQQLAACQR
jgi:hypothetical protein